MRVKVRLLYVLVAAFVIVAAGTMTVNRLDQDILVRQDQAREVRLRQIAVEEKNSDMRQEIAQKDTESYIMDMARRYYGYLLPGEIRFVVVNPESLYEQEPEAQIVDDSVMREAGEGA